MQTFFKRYSLSYIQLTTIIALYFTFIINIPFYTNLYKIFSKLEYVNIGFVLSIPFFMFFALNFLFNLFSWPKITKPIFTLLILISSLISYSGYNYGVVVDEDMLGNILETNTSEAYSYINIPLFFWFTIMGILPCCLLWLTQVKKPKPIFTFIIKKAFITLVSLLIFIAIILSFYQSYASIGRNNKFLRKIIIPTEFLVDASHYFYNNYLEKPIPYRNIALDAKQTPKALKTASTKPTLLVFIVGETARSQNYALNGYSRSTNPYTKNLNVISFSQVHSCGTATRVSVPCMFSQLGRLNYDRKQAFSQDNLIDILKRANINLLWKENDGGDKSVAKNIKEIVMDKSTENKFCDGSVCKDESLLNSFSKEAQSMNGNRVIFLHLMGSHGPTYYQRYPREKARFKPECLRSDIENCSLSEIANTYDNTIVYTDYIIAKTIKQLQTLQNRYNTALIYVSDHGESLGENNIFLHGMPYALAPEYQTKVPLMTWMSEGFAKEKHVNQKCLAQEALNKHYSHDNIFSSVLGLMDVSTKAYDSKLDIFAACRNQPN